MKVAIFLAAALLSMSALADDMPTYKLELKTACSNPPACRCRSIPNSAWK
jgi:hypothetical protein